MASYNDTPLKRLLTLGLLVGLALTVNLLEGMLPQPLPGVKPGLANVFFLVALVLWGCPEAWTVTVLRVCLAGLLQGNGLAFLCSAAGALASNTVACGIFKATDRRCSLPILSLASAVVHNLAQLAVVAALTELRILLWYGPVLMLTAIASGVMVGFLAWLVIERIKKSGIPLEGVPYSD